MSLASLLSLVALAAGFASAKAPGIEQNRVEEVVADRHVALSLCYEDGRDRDPKLQGTVAVVMDVEESGRVVDAKSGRGTSIGDKLVVSCVLDVMKTLDFGKLEQPQTVRYTARFFEQPAEKDAPKKDE